MNYHQKANITLTVVFLFFLCAAVLEHFNPGNFGIRLISFVSEAALVGGIADWFAVTAIFKKPLGWGYHTALIPRNRDKVIEAVASIVQKELLNMNLIRKKIEEISFIDKLFLRVEKKGGPVYLTDKVLFFLRHLAEKQVPDQLAESLAESIRSAAGNRDLAPMVKSIGGWALKHGYIDLGLDYLAEGLWEKAAEEETYKAILRYLEEVKEEKVSSSGSLFRTLMGFVELSDGINLEEAADILHGELLSTLRKLRDPMDPLRISLKDTLLNKAAELEFDTRFCSQIELWKEDILREQLFSKFLGSILEEALKAASSPSTPSDPNALYKVIYPFVEKYWVSVLENTALRERINRFIVDTLGGLIQNEHNLIGSMVRETLAASTDQDLTRFVEDKAGNDLQWIRINGSIIGGIVGLLLFLFLNFVYDPHIMPVLMTLISNAKL